MGVYGLSEEMPAGASQAENTQPVLALHPAHRAGAR